MFAKSQSENSILFHLEDVKKLGLSVKLPRGRIFDGELTQNMKKTVANFFIFFCKLSNMRQHRGLPSQSG